MSVYLHGTVPVTVEISDGEVVKVVVEDEFFKYVGTGVIDTTTGQEPLRTDREVEKYQTIAEGQDWPAWCFGW